MQGAGDDEDLDLHSRKDVHKGTHFPLRSCWVTLTPLPSTTDGFQPVLLIAITQHFTYHVLNAALRLVWKYYLSVSVPTCACGGYLFSCGLETSD